MSEKRHCIFTGKPSDFKLKINNSKDDLQNWAKSVPCCKEYMKSANLANRALNKHEMKLIELFYEQEVAKLRASNIEVQMAEIRAKMGESRKPLRPSKVTREDFDMTDEEYDEEYGDEEDNPEWPGMDQCSKCDTVLKDAAGIGPFCPNPLCEIGDGPFYVDEPDEPLPPECWETKIKPTKVLTEEEKDVKVEEDEGIWD